MKTFTLDTVNGRRAQFINVSNPRNTVTFNVVRASKNAGSMKVLGIRWELRSNATLDIPNPDCKDGCAPKSSERVSVLTSMSGSLENRDALIAMLDEHLTILGKQRDRLMNGVNVSTADFQVGE